jgi:hypothetical protein
MRWDKFRERLPGVQVINQRTEIWMVVKDPKISQPWLV